MIYRITLLLSLLISIQVSAQDVVKRNLYYGNQAFVEGDYEDAVDYYEDAVSESPLNYKANYNLANAYFRMAEFDKTIEHLNTVVNLAPSSYDKSKVYHNIGNAYMMKQEWDKAIDAYKSGLRLNPSDEETRYNLAYALQLKQEQENQQKEKQDQDSNGGDGQNSGENQNGEQNENQNENENQNDEQNENGNDNQNEEQNNGDNQSDGNQNGTDETDENGSPQDYSSKLSKEQIQNILDTYYKREKELQKKIDKNKRVGYGTPKKKDW